MSFEKIPYGQRQIAVSHPEYEPFSQALSVGWFSSHPQIKAELKPRPVELTVQTTAGAEVFLSGTSIGRAGQDGVLVKQNVLPGDYQISVKLSGYNEWNAQDHLGPPRKTLFAYLQISAEKIRQIEANRAQVFQHIGEARRLFAARNYQGSLATLNAALALDPQNNEAKSLRDQVDQTMKILGGR